MTRILVVEDSPTQAQEICLVLTAAGFEVEVAGDGEAGLQRLAERRFDLVVSDILMPGMSGYDLCRRIKATRATKDLPVILLTTLNDALDIIQGLESGADNFITKPYQANHLLERVQTILTHRALRSEGKLRVGVEIIFLGRKFTITSDKEQILDLLLATFEDMVRTNRELQSSQRALAAANNELETFSYSVSHDLRAPLRAIGGFSAALLEEQAERLDQRGRDYLDRICAATQRMGQLIDDLLELARVARGDLVRTTVRLGAMASACAAELVGRDASRQVEWNIATELRADGDPRLLKIVLENLLSNAWKFTRHRERARIEVGAIRRDGERVYYVRDNGAGFDMSLADRIFAPFQRLHTSQEFEGTGVGLATVQRIVHRHGGDIWAEASVGDGATFWFTLGEQENVGWEA
jgi:two-component system, sensor histidine kinase and response regulator